MDTLKKPIILIAVSLIFLVGLFYFFFHKSPNRETDAIAVTASSVIQKEVTVSASAIGTVLPYTSVAVKSRVEGQVTEVDFKEGDFVHEGQVIFQIDPQPYKVVLEESEAAVARDQATEENYQHLLSRYTPLIKKGYVSKQMYDEALANVRAENAMIKADNAAVSNAKLNLSFCTIRAPISGRTGSILINRGNLIKVNDQNPLVVINQLTPVSIVFSLPEADLASLKKAIALHEIPVSLNIIKDQKALQGTLNFIDNTVDSTTGMIQLKALYPNTKEELWPGMYVNVKLPLMQIKNAVVVPTRAIQEGPEGMFVFVINSDSRVSKKSITEGRSMHGQTVIETGLLPGMQVVTTGQLQLTEGSKVQLRTVE